MKLFLIVLIIFQFKVFAKVWTIEGKKYDDELWKIGEYLDRENAPRGTFLYDENHFVVTKGQFHQNDPVGSKGVFVYEQKEWDNAGEFNNSIVEQLNNNQLSYNKAYDMLKRGYEFDSHFLAFRHNLVKILVAEKKYEQAMFHLDFLMSRYPKIPRNYLYTGKIYERLQKKRKAYRTYKKCIKVSDLYTECFLALSNYYLKNKRYKLARKVLLQIPQDAPNYYDAYIGLAKIYLQTGRPNRAYKILKNLDSYYKNYPKEFHFYLAEASRRIGKLREARIEYETFLKYQDDIFFINYPRYRIVNRIKTLN